MGSTVDVGSKVERLDVGVCSSAEPLHGGALLGGVRYEEREELCASSCSLSKGSGPDDATVSGLTADEDVSSGMEASPPFAVAPL